MRVGIGVDAHAFDVSRPLVLGGVHIMDAPGLAGWSDADVVSHAIADALLGAAGLGDLGTYFPRETVAEGVSSQVLLVEVAHLVAEAGYVIGNIDCVVVLQEVRLAPHRARMEETLASSLGLELGTVSVKATTTDRLGFAGRGEGAGAMAVALLELKESGDGSRAR
jgi:2-C-methyl-D-erythritol 2,4-cyclodiphosphate synthase